MSNQSKDAEYTMGRSKGETERLIKQSQLYEDVTRRFFLRSGIAKGMKVLDVGSGAGDVALTLAEFVGPDGTVVGIDLNPDILKTAQARADAAVFQTLNSLRVIPEPLDFRTILMLLSGDLS